jgi:phosphatidylinositol kinase/protein kinase (PI-3  family)
MDVLRQNQETILTILEVLLYDPLYAWTLTSEKAYKCQEIDVGTSEIIDSKLDCFFVV